MRILRIAPGGMIQFYAAETIAIAFGIEIGGGGKK